MVGIFLLPNISLQPASAESNIQPKVLDLSVGYTAAKAAGPQYAITQVLTDQQPKVEWFRWLYNFSRNLLNIMLFLFLVYVAFMNILNKDINTYAIKSILPKVIAAAVIANLAVPIFALFSGMIDNLQEKVSIFNPKSIDYTYIVKGSGFWRETSVFAAIVTIGTAMTGNLVGLGCFAAALIIFGGLIIAFLLNLTLAFRPYVVLLSVAISPLAMGCYILPQTKSFFDRWLKIVIPWLIMPLVVFFLYNIGNKMPVTFTIDNDGFVSSLVGTFLPALVRAGFLLLALRFPFTIEKDVSGAIAQISKRAPLALKQGALVVADAAYKWDKANQQKAEEAGIADAAKYDGANKDQFVESYTPYLMRRDRVSETEAQARAGELFDNLGGENGGEKRKSEYGKASVSNRIDEYKRKGISVFGRTIGGNQSQALLTTAAILSMPQGVYDAIKTRKEVRTKEQVKTAQKALFAQLGIPTGWARDDLKYHEERLTPDVNALHTLDDLQAFIGASTYAKLYENAKKKHGLDDEQARQFVTDRLNKLNLDQESVYTWAAQDLTEGMSADKVAGLKLAWGRMKQVGASNRQRGGREVEKKIEESRSRMYGGGYDGGEEPTESETQTTGETGSDEHNGNGEGKDGKDNKEPNGGGDSDNGRVIALLEEISAHLKQGSGSAFDAFVGLNKKTPSPDKLNVNDIQNQIDRGLGALSSNQAVVRTEIGDMSIARLAKRIANKNILSMLPLIQTVKRLNPQNNDAFAGIEEYYGKEMVKAASFSNSEGAMGVQQSAPKVINALTKGQYSPDQIEQACKVIALKDIGGSVSQDEFRKATEVYDGVIPGAIKKQDGEIVVSGEQARSLHRAVEVSVVRDLSGKASVILNPEEIKLRSGVQAQRDDEIVGLGRVTYSILESKQGRLSSNLPIINGNDEALLRRLAQDAVKHHMYLQQGNDWETQNDATKEGVVNALYNRIASDIKANDTDISYSDSVQTSFADFVAQAYSAIARQQPPTQQT